MPIWNKRRTGYASVPAAKMVVSLFQVRESIGNFKGDWKSVEMFLGYEVTTIRDDTKRVKRLSRKKDAGGKPLSEGCGVFSKPFVSSLLWLPSVCHLASVLLY